MTRDTRNQRALTLAHRLENIIAANITNGVRQLETERVIAAAGPPKGEQAGTRGTGTTSSTERNANESHRLGLMIDDLKDAIDGAEIAVAHLDRLASEACRTRAFGATPDIEPAAADAPRCRDNQHGRQGTIEWGRPDCLELPTKAGLCDACYHRERRWRKAHNLTPRDIEEAA
jgi:hypothetical protein